MEQRKQSTLDQLEMSSTLLQKPITFVLPGEHRSGGVRVTMLMANELLKRDLDVRIICLRPKETPINLAKRLLRSRFGFRKNTGWLDEFNGALERTADLNRAGFTKGEIVIAVGTYVVPIVRDLKAQVTRIRYNHGLPAVQSEKNLASWKGSMPTITVSNTLITKLEELSGEKVMAVIPNGIDTKQYFPDQSIERDGIGAVYNPHPNKDPEMMIKVLRTAHENMPNIPQYVFSTEERPDGLEHTHFTRYPSVDEARRIYSRAKAWLMTSKTEGLPGVALEAMACGCAMVTSDNDGSLEIVRNDVNGIVVPQLETDSYLHALDAICRKEPLRENLSKAARATAESFSWDKAAEKMQVFLESLVNQLGHAR